MGQRNTKNRKYIQGGKVCPLEKRNVSRSAAWGLPERDDNYLRPSLADVVAEFGLTVPYEPSYNLCHSRLDPCLEQNDINCSQRNTDKQEMTYLFPMELGSRSNTFFSTIRDKIFLLQSSFQHVTFKREDTRRPDMPVSFPRDYLNKGRSAEHLEHLENLKETFELHDVGNKGFLTKSEMLESVKSLGHNPTEQDTWKLLAKIDVDHNSLVCFEEFSELAERHEVDHRQELAMCWRALDPSGKGRVNLRQLVQVMRHGVKFQGDLREIFQDYSQEEEINYQQFIFSITNSRKEAS